MQRSFGAVLMCMHLAWCLKRLLVQAANRLMSVDAFRVLCCMYRAQTRAPAVEPSTSSDRPQSQEPEASSSSGPPMPSPSPTVVRITSTSNAAMQYTAADAFTHASHMQEQADFCPSSQIMRERGGIKTALCRS